MDHLVQLYPQHGYQLFLLVFHSTWRKLPRTAILPSLCACAAQILMINVCICFPIPCIFDWPMQANPLLLSIFPLPHYYLSQVFIFLPQVTVYHWNFLPTPDIAHWSCFISVLLSPPAVLSWCLRLLNHYRLIVLPSFSLLPPSVDLFTKRELSAIKSWSFQHPPRDLSRWTCLSSLRIQVPWFRWVLSAASCFSLSICYYPEAFEWSFPKKTLPSFRQDRW